LPVIFSSGYALQTLVEQGRAHARAIILSKPTASPNLRTD
jgi:hypothetical protein